MPSSESRRFPPALDLSQGANTGRVRAVFTGGDGPILKVGTVRLGLHISTDTGQVQEGPAPR